MSHKISKAKRMLMLPSQGRNLVIRNLLCMDASPRRQLRKASASLQVSICPPLGQMLPLPRAVSCCWGPGPGLKPLSDATGH